MVWRSSGVSWQGGAPRLRWAGAGGRVSPLPYGRELGFRAVGERRCSGARGNPCPLAAAVPGRSTGGRCAECARLDRAHSVAADTIADDPRPYRVYLAWFGPGMVKVGITGEERGSARLLEQGAIAFAWLGRGPLMAARRTEEVLRHALAVPDRIPYARKRAVRYALPPAEERARELTELYGQAAGVPAWAETLQALPCQVQDHAEAFALHALASSPPGHVVTELVAGRLVAAAGPDLHLLDADDRPLVLDTRLLTGWELAAAPAGHPVTVPTAAAPAPTCADAAAQAPLF
ncbi:DUF2797 domain-containing protein [Streptomyces sp. SKN60]|uniref:DUF2797 domain-containing protein n=1 Tax=Streptomyces sp. SKN60 TaxID=2855506 RepID=UPI002246BFDB|nr:DUF2797 domain-containing protein [Streptomyces sp. SKN60]MCX2179061.1 DUF2797 domain-containing protein [Streptomyces sp. SKN60]